MLERFIAIPSACVVCSKVPSTPKLHHARNSASNLLQSAVVGPREVRQLSCCHGEGEDAFLTSGGPRSLLPPLSIVAWEYRERQHTEEHEVLMGTE